MGLLACLVLSAQSRHTVEVCDLYLATDVNHPYCDFRDSATIGGLRFEDYKVTNPTAIQFDPAQRMKELAALGTSTANTLCEAPPAFTTPAPTITFDKSSVVGQIYWVPVGPLDNAPFEFMDVQFSNFTASNGYASPHFGFRMIRQLAPDGTEVQQYQIQMQEGNAGLQNIAGLPGGAGTGFRVDPVSKTATVIGTTPSADLLRGAILGVFLNAQSIMNAAKFTVTNPAASGYTLWSGAELISLTGQAQPWIASAVGTTIPIGPPYKCPVTYSNGYGICDGTDQLNAFANMTLAQGGEYLALRTQQSFNVLASNLRSWATANAPSVDPEYEANNAYSFTIAKWTIATPIVMLWPTLRIDPALSPADRQTIENWIDNWLVPPVPVPDFFPDDLGYWADEVVMADAIRRSDDAGFAHGVQRFYGALAQMRADGSFPLAARLSACSVPYSDDDLIHLMSMAEMAATQGYDLYSLSVNGKSLETAIEFMLNARDNPALLYQYSKAGGGICFEGNPGDPPDFVGTFGPPPSASLAWIEPYLARFPFSATSARLRNILGSNVSAAWFPLALPRAGLNTSCSFRKSYELQPVNGANLAIVSGNNQTVVQNQTASAPLVVRVTDNSGKALAGELVSFAVTRGSAHLVPPAQILTDATGTASATLSGPVNGPVTVTATALGVKATFSTSVPGMAIYSAGIAGIGASVPPVSTISQGSLFTIYGQNFVPAGTGRRVNPDEIVGGVLPTTLLGVCVSVGGLNAPLLDVYSGQINAVAPAVGPPDSTTQVVVTTGCGTPSAVQSAPQPVTVAYTNPEFLYFAHNANGVNPVAAINAITGAYVGPTELGSSFLPAHPGDVVTVFLAGLGPTNPPIAPGATANGVARMTSTFAVTLGPVTLGASDVLYAGAAPGEVISQLNIRIPSGVSAGNQPLQIQIPPGGPASPPGAYLPIAVP